MDIISKRRDFFHTLSPHIPTKLSKLFSFGYETLVAQPVTSTRANARRSQYRWHTAKSKMYRLLKNSYLLDTLTSLLTKLKLVNQRDIVAVDFSDFGNGRQVLMFAKQTKQGRALPLYFEVMEYPIKKGSQNLFVVATIQRFYATVGCTPTLVFDRGFACPYIVDFLAKNKHRFIIRIKKRKQMTTSDGTDYRAAEDHCSSDLLVDVYQHKLRLVVSDDPLNGNDPWYLITNDTSVTRKTTIDRYYYRFEIEEFFRDAKRLLRLEWVNTKTKQSLSVLLWFATITMWLFELVAEEMTKEQEQERMTYKLSRFRYVLELFEKAVWQRVLPIAEPGGG